MVLPQPISSLDLYHVEHFFIDTIPPQHGIIIEMISRYKSCPLFRNRFPLFSHNSCGVEDAGWEVKGFSLA